MLQIYEWHKPGRQAAFPSIHVEHEDNKFDGSARDDGRNQEGLGI